MATASDIETYMLRMGLDYQLLSDGLWLVHDEVDHIDNIVVSLVDPIVIFRVKLFELPPGAPAELFRLLLTLNANEMVHGAFGLEGDSVVLVDTLQSENLDYNEFQASLESISLSMIQHYSAISGLLRQMEASP